MKISIKSFLSIGILPSFLKVRYYRLRGAKIGKGVEIGLFSTINADKIIIGDYSKIGMLVSITAREFVMGSHSQIKMMTVMEAQKIIIGNETLIMEQIIVGGMPSYTSEFKIGDRCKVFPFCFINPTCPISIGNDVGIGGSNYLFTHGSWSNSLEGYPISFGPITIEDRVWLAWRVFILPNVTLGQDSIIATGSIVTRSIPSRSLAVGSPAKVRRTGDELVRKLTMDEKLQILKKMLDELRAFFIIKRKQVLFKPEVVKENGIIWAADLLHKKQKVGTLFFSKYINQELLGIGELKTYYFSLGAIPEELRSQITEIKQTWFDLEHYQWDGARAEIATELREFFSRFGVRFESIALSK